MKKLDLSALDVDSFETSALSNSYSDVLQPYDTLTTSNDPTAATRCYYCPLKPVTTEETF